MDIEGIPTTLFKDNTLVIVKFSCWTGIVSIKKGDERAFGADNVDERFFKKGSVILCDKKKLKKFSNKQQALTCWMNNHGSSFLMIPGCRLFKNSVMQEVADKIAECKAEMSLLVEEFLQEYPAEIESRKVAFNDSHLEHIGAMDKYFPSMAALQGKFGVSYLPIKITNAEEAERIFRDESATMRAHIHGFMYELAGEFRSKVVEAALAFKAGMDKAGTNEDGRINAKSVTAFKDFMARIKHNNFLNDSKVDTLLTSIGDNLYSVNDWNIHSDEDAMGLIKQHLDSLISLAEDEGETSSVVRSYIAFDDLEIAAEDYVAETTVYINDTNDDVEEIDSGMGAIGDTDSSDTLLLLEQTEVSDPPWEEEDAEDALSTTEIQSETSKWLHGDHLSSIISLTENKESDVQLTVSVLPVLAENPLALLGRGMPPLTLLQK